MSQMTREQLEEIIGRMALREYDDARDYARPDLMAWAAGLRDLTDKDLGDEVTSATADAAFANSRGWWWDPSWCKTSACSFEARRRYLLAGHAENCGGDDLYQKNYRRAMRNAGYNPGPVSPCDCGHDPQPTHP
jgi:hypothetical protein